jgi:hypothetical protein
MADEKKKKTPSWSEWAKGINPFAKATEVLTPTQKAVTPEQAAKRKRERQMQQAILGGSRVKR